MEWVTFSRLLVTTNGSNLPGTWTELLKEFTKGQSTISFSFASWNSKTTRIKWKRLLIGIDL